MCGISGAVWTDPGLAIEAEVLREMTQRLRHRGPDDEGSYVRDFQLRPPYEPVPGVALGFRRLSIIDVAGGHQPLANEDESVWVVFNGEIYNFPDLRRRLEGAGHTFRTRSDTETIVHLYEDEGPDCFRHLNGMFALALWDARQRQLVLARDRLGKKPLVYRQQPGRLTFASELKSLLAVPGCPREIDPGAIDEYLTYQYIPYPRTIFRGLAKLPPGHFAVYREDKLTVQPYWRPNWNAERSWTREAAAAELRNLLESAVRMRMQSEVPLGAFLSGGVDSSLIVALMQRMADQPIKTFSIGFPEKDYDETRYARQVARHLGTDHQEFIVQPDGVAILPKLVWHFDEPFADSSAVPTWYVSQITRHHVTVALTGDGGDELFAGYPRYRAIALARVLDEFAPLRSLLAARGWQLLPGARQKSLTRRFKRFSASLSESPQRRYLEWIAIFNEARRAELYRDEFLEQLPDSDPSRFLEQAWNQAGARDPVTAASLADVTTYLCCDLMTKVDIASMAHSLECRQPLLDYRVVEFAASLPLALKYRRGRGKRLLQDAFGELLPREIWRRRKMGFGVPIEDWFRGDLKSLTRSVLLDPQALCLPYFRLDVIRRLIDEHERRVFDHAYRLWALLVLELWLRQWLKG